MLKDLLDVILMTFKYSKILSDINYDFQFEENKILFYNQYENKQYNIEELNSLILKKIVSSANKQLE